jgi:uncharacterized protein YjdB
MQHISNGALPRALLFLSLFVAACADDPSAPKGVGSLELVQRTMDLEIGESTTLNARVLDLRGRTMAAAVTWSSSNAGVASVAPGGSVAAVSAGTAWITASTAEKRDSARITVVDPIAGVQVSEHAVALTVGSTRELAAVVRDSEGRIRSGVNIDWSTTDPMIAAVSPSGTVTAIYPGTAIIRAAAGARSDSAVVVVDAPIAKVTITPESFTLERGESVQLRAIVHDVLDRRRTDVPVEWISLDPTAVHVSQSGVATGLAYGRGTNLTASAGGKSASAFVFVNSNAVETFRYELAFDVRINDGSRAEIRAGGTMPLQAGYDAITGRPIDFGTADVRYDRFTIIAVEGSMCTATTEAHTGKLNATFTHENPDHPGSYVGKLVPYLGGPREVIHWNCNGNTMIQPVRWLSQILEEVYSTGLITGLQAVSPGRRERKYERVHTLTIGTVTERSTFTLEMVP